MIDMSLYTISGHEEIDSAVIGDSLEKLCTEYFHAKLTKYSYLGGGTFGLAYKVHYDDKVAVIKFYRLKGVNRTQALELRTLVQYCTAKVPAVYFVHDQDEFIPLDAVGMEFVEGVPCVQLNPRYYKKAQRQQLADELTTALHSIHQAKSDTYGFLDGERYATWLDFYKPFAKELHDWAMEYGGDPQHKMSKEFLEVIDYSWQNFDRIFNCPISEPTLIHNDLCVCNFMVDKKTLALTSIIDPNRAMYADMEYDLHNLTNITGNSFYLYDTYKQKYPTSDNCDVKIAFYGLYNEIYYYVITRMSFEYIYPFMTKRLWKEMKKHFAKENINAI